MSSNSKICPDCESNNAAANLTCLKCGASLIHVDFAPNWTERYKGQSQDRHYVLEEFFNPTFVVCMPLALACSALAIFTFGSIFCLFFFCAAMILAALPFFPGDPVGDALRQRLEKARQKQLNQKSE